MSKNAKLTGNKIFENEGFDFYKIPDFDDAFYLQMLKKYPTNWDIDPIIAKRSPWLYASSKRAFERYTEFKPLLLIKSKSDDRIYGSYILEYNPNKPFVYDQEDHPVNDIEAFGLTEQEFAALFNK